MKLLAIAILSLSLVLAEEKNGSSEIGQLDIAELGKNDGETKSSEIQRKRDSGYSHSRPDRFSSSQRYDFSGIRGRIVTKYPASQTIRPFNRYGPPKHSGSQFGKPSAHYAPQHQYSGPANRHPQSSSFENQGNQFSDGQKNGQIQQEVPSPVRSYDFVETSPIASQNNEPFNSNAAGYLPPRNQKLPGYSNSQTFSNEQKTSRIPEDQRIQMTSNQQQQQHIFNNNLQSQSLPQGQFQDQQISDAAIFLAQNAQAISQLYDAPAANLNYEPIPNFQGSTDHKQNPNNQFQTFDLSDGVQSQGFGDSRDFPGNLPSYASGILDSRQTLQRIQSLEKDRLISQLQQALIAQRNVDQQANSGSTSSRYAQNHATGNYVQSEEILASLGQINPSVGPQLDKPSNGQRPFGSGNTAFGQAPIEHGTSATTSAFPFSYGLPSTTPTQSPFSTTTIASSTTTSSTSQRPLQGVTGDGTLQIPTSSFGPSATAATYPFPQYAGFVPLVGTNLLANYPNYGNNFLGSGSSFVPVQTSGSSPTHFGLPIPTIPAASQGTSSVSPSKPPFPPKPQETDAQNHPVHTIPIQPIHPIASTPVQPIFPISPSVTQIHPVQNTVPVQPIQPIQPIHPISSTPVQPIFPISPSVTQIHPVQNTVPVTSGHPSYGAKPAVINPLLLKPVKTVYPIYYYPNVYQIQKPALPTYPWSYAPSYAQTKPVPNWK